MEDAASTSSRKRSRSSTPIPQRPVVVARPESADDQARAAQLRDPSTRVAALNALLQQTVSHEPNYAVTGDSVLTELVNIALECVQWEEPDVRDEDDDEDDDPVFSSDRAWWQAPTKRNDRWAEHWEEQLGPNRLNLKAHAVKTLEVVAMIFRNMSFVGANLRMLAYSPAVVEVLIGCMYDGTKGGAEEVSAPSSTALAVAAMQTLLHMVPMLDLSGQKLLADRLFYTPQSSKDGPMIPNAEAFGQAATGGWGFGGMWLARRLDTKEDVMSDVKKDFLLSFASEYLVSVWSVFPALFQVLTNTLTPRSVLIMAVDLLQELVNQARIGVVGSAHLDDDPDEIPTLRVVLVKMPDPLISRLIDFLYVPRLGPDALEYNDPVKNIVTRVTAYKLLLGYDATVDTDIRDRTLDILVPLLELDSPRIATRLGSRQQSSCTVRTQIWDSLLPILTTAVGRNEAPHLATQVFKELTKAPENRLGLIYVQERLLKLACKNERVAHTACHFLQLIPQQVEEGSEDQNEEEQDGSEEEEEES
eukprot:scaffold3939_cov166-Amphora_coffeaeformis.AAC.21